MSRLNLSGPMLSNGTVPEQTVLGRVTGGNIAALTPAQGMSMLGVYGSWLVPMVAGEYSTAHFGVGTAAIPVENTEYLCTFFVPQRSCTVDRLACWMTIAGSAGAVVRLGMRAWDTANARPGAVLADGDQIAATGAAGALEAVVSVPVVAGTPYCLTLTVQGGAGTRPTLTTTAGLVAPFSNSAPSAGAPNAYVTAVTGALQPAPTWTRAIFTTWRMWVRAGA